jgi:hypothetical protein
MPQNPAVIPSSRLQKHEALSKKIEDEQQRPGSDDLQVTAMKRQKLLLKEEITKLAT